MKEQIGFDVETYENKVIVLGLMPELLHIETSIP